MHVEPLASHVCRSLCSQRLIAGRQLPPGSPCVSHTWPGDPADQTWLNRIEAVIYRKMHCCFYDLIKRCLASDHSPLAKMWKCVAYIWWIAKYVGWTLLGCAGNSCSWLLEGARAWPELLATLVFTLWLSLSFPSSPASPPWVLEPWPNVARAEHGKNPPASKFPSGSHFNNSSWGVDGEAFLLPFLRILS